MDMTTLQRQVFDPETFDEKSWEALIALRRAAFVESNPDDPVPSADFMRKSMMMLADNPYYKVHIQLLQSEDGDAVAALMYGLHHPDSPEYEANKFMMMVIPFVMPAYRQQGIGTQLLRDVLNIAKAKNITLLQGDTSTTAGHAFAAKLGASKAIESKTSRLYLKDMNWDMIEAWHQDGITRNPDTTIETWIGLPPDEDIENYCEIYTRVLNQQPFDDAEGMALSITPQRLQKQDAHMQERNITQVTKITREADGTISGLTDISYNPERTHFIGQGLTGVEEDYRGRGLGKWLKADMLLYIREHYPDIQHIETGNASSNDAMLSINVRMGFQLYKHDVMYKLSVADVTLD